MAVDAYKQTNEPAYKKELQEYITTLKDAFREELKSQSPINKKLSKVRGDLTMMENPSVFGEQQYTDKQIETKRRELEKLEQEKADLENNVIYHNAFEWRFEFPEVLDEKAQFTGFDLVIGNPPYIQMSKDQQFSKKYIDFLKTQFNTSGGRANTFIFFIHLGLTILSPKRYLSNIIPNTILTQEYYEYTREQLLKENALNEIITYPKLPFKEAIVETVSILVSKGSKKDNPIKILELSEDNKQVIASKNEQDFIREPNFAFSFSTDSIVDKAFKVKNEKLKDICNLNQAIALKGDKSQSIKYENPEGEYYKLLDGRDIHKYSINWDGKFLKYDLNKIHSCKRKDIFELPEKLLMRRVSSSLIFTYDDRQFFGLNTLVVLTLKNKDSNFDLKYLLALLNSKLLDYIYNKKFKSTKTVFSEIQARSVGNLPIPKISQKDQKLFFDKAQEIIDLKKDDPGNETRALEKEIDQKVYELFGLTEEEVGIVEGY
jgi:hypothetical protein